MDGQHHQNLVRKAQGLTPIRTAVVHPIDEVSLMGAIRAAEAGLIIPVLVGPEQKIRSAASKAGVDLSAYELVAAEHSHAAAAQAVVLATLHKVEALMKGSIHTDEFMGAIVREEKLRTARRISHVFIIDTPGYPRPLFVTDAGVNIYPTLQDKVDIVQNAIDLAHALGLELPRVAILSAVETVHGRHPRWTAGIRQCGFRGSREDQGYRIPSRGTCRYSCRARFGGRQHACEAA